MQLTLLGAKVDVYESGCGAHSALLLHGWGCSAQLMESVQKALEGSMHVVSLDFPGHGKGGKALPPPQPWGVPEYMEMTAQLIRRLDMAPCDIVAHSFGGRVAILLAATYPELVGRLVITGGAGVKKPASGKLSMKTRVYRGLRGAMNVAEKTRLFGDLPEKGREALVQRFGSPDYRALTPEMRRTFNKVIAQDLTGELPKVKAPTLLFWGEDDTETPLWMAKVMEEKIPDAGLVTQPGAGHFAYLEKNALFLRVVRSFFEVK